MRSENGSERIRQFVTREYLQPARQRGETTFTVRAGDVHKRLGLKQRMPQVCLALRSQKFLRDNSLRLLNQTGPESGQSSTVTYTYQFIDGGHDTRPKDRDKDMEWFLSGRGLLEDLFKEVGGGEAFLKGERSEEAWRRGGKG